MALKRSGRLGCQLHHRLPARSGQAPNTLGNGNEFVHVTSPILEIALGKWGTAKRRLGVGFPGGAALVSRRYRFCAHWIQRLVSGTTSRRAGSMGLPHTFTDAIVALFGLAQGRLEGASLAFGPLLEGQAHLPLVDAGISLAQAVIALAFQPFLKARDLGQGFGQPLCKALLETENHACHLNPSLLLVVFPALLTLKPRQTRAAHPSPGGRPPLPPPQAPLALLPPRVPPPLRPPPALRALPPPRVPPPASSSASGASGSTSASGTTASSSASGASGSTSASGTCASSSPSWAIKTVASSAARTSSSGCSSGSTAWTSSSGAAGPGGQPTRPTRTRGPA
jgi:hypothetical protein